MPSPNHAAPRRRPLARAVAAGGALTVALATATPGRAYQRPGTVQRVNVSSSEDQAVDPEATVVNTGGASAVSGNGRYVAFSSSAANLVPGDVNGAADIFVRDLLEGKTELVSVSYLGGIASASLGACSSPGQEGSAGSSGAAISSDGRYVAFSSCATNLVPGDTNLRADVFLRDRVKKRTVRVSVASDESEPMEPVTGFFSALPSVTPNGRFVAFSSSATDLVAKDTNGEPDIFVRDLVKGRTELVSKAKNGELANRSNYCASISNDGRYVAFASYATNLAPDNDTAIADAYRKDRQTGAVMRVSVPVREPITGQGNGGAPCVNGGRGISGDGRYVVFTSGDPNLVPIDSNNQFDVFLYDTKVKRTHRVTVDSVGREGTYSVGLGALSVSGRFIAFASNSAYFAGDTGSIAGPPVPAITSVGDYDVFVYDMAAKALDWVSVSEAGKEATGCNPLGASGADFGDSKAPSISGDGRIVSFQSCATNLVPNDTNKTTDLFARDRGAPVGVGELGRTGSGAAAVPSGSSDRVGILSLPDPDDDSVAAQVAGSEITHADLRHRPSERDILAWIDLADLPARPLGIAALDRLDPVVYGVRLETKGERYELRASAVALSTGGRPAFGLFRCDDLGCSKLRDLTGSYGTVGNVVTISVPVHALGLQKGGTIAGVEAFTSLGAFELTPRRVLDVARIPAP